MEIKVEYNGSFPNLCSGDLVLVIDGTRWEFPDYCLTSGGAVWFDNGWSEHIDTGEWVIYEWPDDFPESLKEDALAAVNKQVPWGCCGGCV